MATRVIEFFAKPQEFIDFLNEIIISMQLQAILAIRIKDSRVKLLNLPLDLKVLNKIVSYDIFLTDKKISEGIPVVDVNMAREGWIQVVLPKERNGILFEASMGIKTDWYDRKTETIYDNKENIPLFDKIKRKFKKTLKFPVLGYDIRRGDPNIFQIGYTVWRQLSLPLFTLSGGWAFCPFFSSLNLA